MGRPLTKERFIVEQLLTAAARIDKAGKQASCLHSLTVAKAYPPKGLKSEAQRLQRVLLAAIDELKQYEEAI